MPLDRSTMWPYEDGEPGRFYYQRYGHPVGVEAEEELSRLDGGHALLFPSGAGATTALALALLAPGDTIALAAGAYYGTGGTFAALEPWGLRHVEFDQTGAPPDGVQLVWLETPANPFLSFPDLGPVIERAHAELARRLAAHPAVERVRYPGLGDAAAARYLDAFGCLLSFDVRGGADAARRVETGTRLIVNATSLGGTRSLLETRARWEGDRVPENLVRLSVGLEDVEALWDDLEQALARV